MPQYKKISDHISQLVISNPKRKGNLKWINITEAGRKEIEYLRKNYNFNLNHLKASISTVFSQRPMVSEEKGYFFMILHFPVYQQGRIMPAEIEFFISHGYLITVHNKNIPALNIFFEKCKNDVTSLSAYSWESSIILLYDLLEKLINDCYLLIDRNSVGISQTEDLIFSQKQKEAVTMVLNLRRNIISLRKILQNHQDILARLTLVKSSLVPQVQIRKYYDKLVEHSKRIWLMLDNQKEMVEALNNTNESLSNAHMTSIMKTLTIFSVIVYPLTLLAGIFGMNAKNMPFVDHPYGFWMILCLMLVCSLGMLLFFERKRWL